jgi:type II secretory pathway component PulF
VRVNGEKMPKFSYKAIDQAGVTVSGSIEAESAEMAMNLLAGRGYIPSKVAPESAGASGSSGFRLQDMLAKVKATDLILFTKQCRTLLKAGVPILTLLQVLENQTQNPKLRNVAAAMAQDIREGATLYNAFKKHPKVFSELYCSMVRAGETSGALPEVLERLSYIIEHEHKIKSDIKSALQYPITVLVALSIAFFVLLTFVIPKFIAIFKSAGLDLPLPTLICIWLNQFLIGYWYVVLGLVAAVIVGLTQYFKTDQGQYIRDSLILKVPILGPLFIKSGMSRFASIFAILQSSGVPVLESLRILSGTIGNAAIAREFDRIRDLVEEGRGISAPLRSARYFTPMVINMIAIGEESGNLDEMLREISVHYDDEVGYAVKQMSEALGPVLVVGLAGVVGFFALAIFLPMWDLTKMSQK